MRYFYYILALIILALFVLCVMSFPLGTVGKSMICGCGISWPRGYKN